MKLNPSMRTKQMPDKALLLAILMLIIFGWIMMLSASLAHFDSYTFFLKQTLFILNYFTESYFLILESLSQLLRIDYLQFEVALFEFVNDFLV